MTRWVDEVRYGPVLRGLCRASLGADVVGIFGDVDFGASMNVGVAVLTRRLRDNVRPLPAGLARAWEGLLRQAGLAVEAMGRSEGLLFARGSGEAPAVLRQELRAAAEREPGLPGRVSFLATADGLFVGGVLTERPR